VKLLAFGLGAALLGGAPAARAAGIDCTKAHNATERTVCADAELRRLDGSIASDFDEALAAVEGRLRQALVAQQRAWVQRRDQTCRSGDADCLQASYRARLAALDALTARISPGNPTLSDVTAVALLGTWKVDGYLVPGTPDRQVSPAEKPAYLPMPGSRITGQPGKLCSADGECLPFGLDRQKLDDASALRVAPDTPLYVAYLAGKSVYELIPRQNGSLLARFLLCDKSYATCAPAFQVWEPASPDAAVRVLAH
jgi:uncharacterized protein